jgi:hypothetical protein
LTAEKKAFAKACLTGKNRDKTGKIANFKALLLTKAIFII